MPGKGTREQVRVLEQESSQPDLCCCQIAKFSPMPSVVYEKVCLERGREGESDLTNPRHGPAITYIQPWAKFVVLSPDLLTRQLVPSVLYLSQPKGLPEGDKAAMEPSITPLPLSGSSWVRSAPCLRGDTPLIWLPWTPLCAQTGPGPLVTLSYLILTATLRASDFFLF